MSVVSLCSLLKGAPFPARPLSRRDRDRDRERERKEKKGISLSRGLYLEGIVHGKVERGPSNGIVCSIADHITTNIPFTCYHLYGRNLQTKRHEHGFRNLEMK